MAMGGPCTLQSRVARSFRFWCPLRLEGGAGGEKLALLPDAISDVCYRPSTQSHKLCLKSESLIRVTLRVA